MNFISDKLHLKIPGSILGIFFHFFYSIAIKGAPAGMGRSGFELAFGEMLLFFIPPAAGMIEYKKNLLIHSG